ncbi:DUF4625 domain-containing protein [Plebeiibacterium sediminum]|uniref:DUF4625 domain-containing protein n=1 Tax=Plebeiibacterium sediminum TaxID=2992112 RepID=A0AAE3M1V4_9BACT|nr:DUF4625 domain-containing protein [Plebeiobacterium sediminum]MCW3785200.1 DUF4625 domain-containing protein [Plebeiobacterium sediminum]
MKKILFIAMLTSLIIACSDSKDIDDIKPEIDTNVSFAFPKQCTTLYFGEDFNFSALFTDNIELGSYSISLHNNFDHHSHSTEVTECELGEIKTPVNPFTFIQDFEIPDNLTEYEANQSITIPTGDENGLFDEGDYHFFISLTDKQGWSTQKGLSIKIMHRE